MDQAQQPLSDESMRRMLELILEECRRHHKVRVTPAVELCGHDVQKRTATVVFCVTSSEGFLSFYKEDFENYLIEVGRVFRNILIEQKGYRVDDEKGLLLTLDWRALDRTPV